MQLKDSDFLSNIDNYITQGDHIACIYKTNEQMYSLVAPFFIDGINKRNKCVFVLGDSSKEEVIKAFNQQDFNLQIYLDSGSFEFYSNEQVYLKNGVFNADSTITDLVTLESDAIKNGYTGLRIVGSASWSLTPPKKVDDLVSYEAQVSDFIKFSLITAACLYKESLYTSQELVRVIRTHPLVFIYDKLFKNPYFMPLSDQSDKYVEKMTYEEIIKGLYF